MLGSSHCAVIAEWLPGKTYKLLYRATRDGFTALAFHTKCDNQGPTVTVITSGKNVFGGYSEASWDSHSVWKTGHAFIFTLSNPHNIPPTKFLPGSNPSPTAISCKKKDGPSFGGGYDIHVSDNSNVNAESYTFFPISFIDSTRKGYTLFTGKKNFTTTEIEVYAVLP